MDFLLPLRSGIEDASFSPITGRRRHKASNAVVKTLVWLN
jgi:hypothetical protein